MSPQPLVFRPSLSRWRHPSLSVSQPAYCYLFLSLALSLSLSLSAPTLIYLLSCFVLLLFSTLSPHLSLRFLMFAHCSSLGGWRWVVQDGWWVDGVVGWGVANLIWWCHGKYFNLCSNPITITAAVAPTTTAECTMRRTKDEGRECEGRGVNVGNKNSESNSNNNNAFISVLLLSDFASFLSVFSFSGWFLSFPFLFCFHFVGQKNQANLYPWLPTFPPPLPSMWLICIFHSAPFAVLAAIQFILISTLNTKNYQFNFMTLFFSPATWRISQKELRTEKPRLGKSVENVGENAEIDRSALSWHQIEMKSASRKGQWERKTCDTFPLGYLYRWLYLSTCFRIFALP